MEQPPTPAQRRKQLLGIWRSDKKKTIEELAKRRDISEKQLEFFRTIFGKLEVHYRPKTAIVLLNGKKRVQRYKILGADSYSIAILFEQRPPPFAGPKIQLITFEKDFFWITLGGGMREFFKRIKFSASRRDIRK